MIEEFNTFINTIAEITQFDRNNLQLFYQNMLEADNKTKYNKFLEEFQGVWDKWVEINSSDEIDISQFFVEKGEQLFRNWFYTFFPFHTGTKQLILGFESGGTTEDIVIHMFYRFTMKELQIVDVSLAVNEIWGVPRTSALTRVFLEAFLAMRPIISKVIGYQISLMVEESKFLKKEQGRILFLEMVARPSE